eukprot:1161089-Pelagomonas_calceolata.AAC.3
MALLVIIQVGYSTFVFRGLASRPPFPIKPLRSRSALRRHLSTRINTHTHHRELDASHRHRRRSNRRPTLCSEGGPLDYTADKCGSFCAPCELASPAAGASKQHIGHEGI